MTGDLDPAQLERLAKEFDADPRTGCCRTR